MVPNEIYNNIKSNISYYGTWEWAVKQMKDGKIVRRPEWKSVKIIYSDINRVGNFNKIENDWELVINDE